MRECGAALVSPPDRGSVGTPRVRGQIEDVAVTARREHYRIGRMRLDLARDQVAYNDSTRPSIDHHQIKHLGARIHRNEPLGNLLLECLIRAEEQLLAGLSASVERARHLCTAERAIGQRSAVFASEGYALRHVLIDHVVRKLCEAITI